MLQPAAPVRVGVVHESEGTNEGRIVELKAVREARSESAHWNLVRTNVGGDELGSAHLSSSRSLGRRASGYCLAQPGAGRFGGPPVRPKNEVDEEAEVNLSASCVLA